MARPGLEGRRVSEHPGERLSVDRSIDAVDGGELLHRRATTGRGMLLSKKPQILQCLLSSGAVETRIEL